MPDGVTYAVQVIDSGFNSIRDRIVVPSSMHAMLPCIAAITLRAFGTDCFPLLLIPSRLFLPWVCVCGSCGFNCIGQNAKEMMEPEERGMKWLCKYAHPPCY